MDHYSGYILIWTVRFILGLRPLMVRWKPFIICRDWVRNYCFDQQNDRFQGKLFEEIKEAWHPS